MKIEMMCPVRGDSVEMTTTESDLCGWLVRDVSDLDGEWLIKDEDGRKWTINGHMLHIQQIEMGHWYLEG